MDTAPAAPTEPTVPTVPTPHPTAPTVPVYEAFLVFNFVISTGKFRKAWDTASSSRVPATNYFFMVPEVRIFDTVPPNCYSKIFLVFCFEFYTGKFGNFLSPVSKCMVPGNDSSTP